MATTFFEPKPHADPMAALTNFLDVAAREQFSLLKYRHPFPGSKVAADKANLTAAEVAAFKSQLYPSFQMGLMPFGYDYIETQSGWRNPYQADSSEDIITRRPNVDFNFQFNAANEKTAPLNKFLMLSLLSEKARSYQSQPNGAAHMKKLLSNEAVTNVFDKHNNPGFWAMTALYLKQCCLGQFSALGKPTTAREIAKATQSL